MRFRLEPYLFRCESCSRNWQLMDTQSNLSYWCPYCGAEQKPVGMFGQELFNQEPPAPIKEITPKFTQRVKEPEVQKSVEIEENDTQKNVVSNLDDNLLIEEPPKRPPGLLTKKADKRLEAEDMMTAKMCSGGGWWNPVTKACMGEGNGHNLGGDAWYDKEKG